MQFTNPWGFLALLGIPAILLIHFLQRRERSALVTTLFLIESLNLESRKGNRFQRLVTSPPMWLQLLGVLLLTWLLVAPKFVSNDRSQRIALILDSSASMSAFRQDLPEELALLVERSRLLDTRIDLLVIEDDISRSPLYRGTSIEEMKAAMESWSPGGSARSPEQALRSSRTILGETAQLIYITDHEMEKPGYRSGISALGEKVTNVGFAGFQFTENGGWEAIVHNYSEEETKRDWWISFPDGSQSKPVALTIPPTSSILLSGEIPADMARLTIHVSGDQFELDDTLPLVVPQPKNLRYTMELDQETQALAAKIFSALPETEIASEQADLVVTSRINFSKQQGTGAAILFSTGPKLDTYISGPITTTRHPLIEGLNWEALAPKVLANPLKVGPADLALLWKGEVPLILLRGEGADQGLIFNFDIRDSGFSKQPAGLILIHRFCESIREKLNRFEKLNLEYREAITLPPLPADTRINSRITALDGEIIERELSPTDVATLAAPEQPGFLEIMMDDEPILEAGVHFADLREADFSAAARASEEPDDAEAETRKLLQTDPMQKIWALSLIAILLGSWAYLK